LQGSFFVTILHLDINIGFVNEKLGDCTVHVVAGDVQGTITILIGEVNHCFVLQEDLNDLDGTLSASVLQRRFTLAITSVYLSVELNKDLYDFGVVSPHGLVKGHLFRVESVVDIGHQSMKLHFLVE